MAWIVDKDFSTPYPYFNFEDEKGTASDLLISPFGPCINIRINFNGKRKVARAEKHGIKDVKRDVFFIDARTVCNQRFKELVESFEPHMHCFIPIELIDDKGATLDGNFYYFTTQQDVDCILTDNAPEWFKKRNPRDPNSNIKSNIRAFKEKRDPDIFLSQPQIEGRHLWTAGQLAWSFLFVSDEFKGAWSKARMRGLTMLKKCKLEDRPWVAEEQMGPMLEDWRRYEASGRTIGGNW